MAIHSPETGFYRIGAVARMTGIALPTLRMWERRYGIVEPHRTPAGGRLYTREHVARLALVQAAVQAGHAIGTIARLPTPEIQARLKAALPDALPGAERCRIAVIGPSLPILMEGRESADPALQIIGAYATPEEAEPALFNKPLDVLILEAPTLQPEEADELLRFLGALGARLAIVVYGFTSRRVLRRLDLMGVLCMRAPADLAQLLRISMLAVPGARGRGERPDDSGQEPPARLYDDRQLVRLSGLSSAIRCECPQHLAVLIGNLVAFERYSRECENAGTDDAVLHAMLHLTTARARQQMELALKRLLAAEGIRA